MNLQNPIASQEAIKSARLPDAQTVTSIKHWSDRLFSFRVTRPRSLRFRSGEFVMIGLMGDNDRPLMRAYSIASPSWDDELEFYSIKVQDGPLTSRLQHIQVGDSVIIRPKPVGTLVLDALLPGKRLYLVSTGTGIAPFASLIGDPELYERFDQVILTHTTRSISGLEYGKQVIKTVYANPLVGEEAFAKLKYYPTTTKEATQVMGRPTELISSGQLSNDLDLPPLDVSSDRVMICGSIGLNKDMKDILEALGFSEGSNSQPGEYVVEKAFVG